MCLDDHSHERGIRSLHAADDVHPARVRLWRRPIKHHRQRAGGHDERRPVSHGEHRRRGAREICTVPRPRDQLERHTRDQGERRTVGPAGIAVRRADLLSDEESGVVERLLGTSLCRSGDGRTADAGLQWEILAAPGHDLRRAVRYDGSLQRRWLPQRERHQRAGRYGHDHPARQSQDGRHQDVHHRLGRRRGSDAESGRGPGSHGDGASRRHRQLFRGDQSDRAHQRHAVDYGDDSGDHPVDCFHSGEFDGSTPGLGGLPGAIRHLGYVSGLDG